MRVHVCGGDGEQQCASSFQPCLQSSESLAPKPTHTPFAVIQRLFNNEHETVHELPVEGVLSPVFERKWLSLPGARYEPSSLVFSAKRH